MKVKEGQRYKQLEKYPKMNPHKEERAQQRLFNARRWLRFESKIIQNFPSKDAWKLCITSVYK